MAGRRARDDSRHRPDAAGPASLAASIARTARGLSCPLDAELWASQMLGMFWSHRYDLPLEEAAGTDPALTYGEPLIEELARLATRECQLALAAIAALDDGELGMRADELLKRDGAAALLPQWAQQLGESQITAAALMREDVFDDARTVFLEARHPDGRGLAVGVLIDNNLGGIAKDVLLADSIEQVAQTLGDHPQSNGELLIEPLEPGVAAGLISAAIELTDMTWDPPVAEDYWPGRALALLRADQTSHVVPAPEREAPEPAQREALFEEFLAAPEGSGIGSDSDAAWAVKLAINFCSDYLDGRPLRFSPVVVELFMADWIPRKVLTSDELLAVLPVALEAWVRFAARKRALPDWARDLTLAAISEWQGEMLARAADPAAGGPPKQFLRAAEGAGVDVCDPKALRAYIESSSPAADPAQTVVQVKIALRRVTKPPVWRRLQLPADIRLDRLHQVIQTAFGWEDYHLHMFEADGVSFGVDDPDLDLDCLDERDTALAELVDAVGDRVLYTYDFGDSWEHEIAVEKLLEREPGAGYPRLLTAKGACPPEDCGGVWGYQNLKEALADPAHPEHAELSEWFEGTTGRATLDPAAVSVQEIAAHLASLRQSV